MKAQLSKRAVLAVVAAAGMIVSAAVAADSKGSFAVPTIAVEYGDLDLTKPEGVRVLHRRLTAAAERVCPRTDVYLSAQDRFAARACRKQALEHAIREIGSPELAALHAAATPRG
jgi:UrcA family protein